MSASTPPGSLSMVLRSPRALSSGWWSIEPADIRIRDDLGDLRTEGVESMYTLSGAAVAMTSRSSGAASELFVMVSTSPWGDD